MKSKILNNTVITSRTPIEVKPAKPLQIDGNFILLVPLCLFFGILFLVLLFGTLLIGFLYIGYY